MDSPDNTKIPPRSHKQQTIALVVVPVIFALGVIIWVGLNGIWKSDMNHLRSNMEIHTRSLGDRMEIQAKHVNSLGSINTDRICSHMDLHVNRLHKKLDVLLEQIDDLKRELEEMKQKQSEPQS